MLFQKKSKLALPWNYVTVSNDFCPVHLIFSFFNSNASIKELLYRVRIEYGAIHYFVHRWMKTKTNFQNYSIHKLPRANSIIWYLNHFNSVSSRGDMENFQQVLQPQPRGRPNPSVAARLFPLVLAAGEKKEEIYKNRKNLKRA